MEQHPPSDPEVQGWLHTLGVASLCQWHVLLFLFRHQTTLLGVEYLAHLLGYTTEAVVAALDVLEARELVARSRVSQGARLYKFLAPLASPSGEAFAQLQALTSDRVGRRRIYTQLRQGDHTAEETLQRAQLYLKNARQRIQEAKRRAQQLEERKQRWLKAI
jgi:DNA-binding MarR family transcriptional regulator